LIEFYLLLEFAGKTNQKTMDTQTEQLLRQIEREEEEVRRLQALKARLLEVQQAKAQLEQVLAINALPAPQPIVLGPTPPLSPVCTPSPTLELAEQDRETQPYVVLMLY
jgi:predicted component of type VI protein secretion system